MRQKVALNLLKILPKLSKPRNAHKDGVVWLSFWCSTYVPWFALSWLGLCFNWLICLLAYFALLALCALLGLLSLGRLRFACLLTDLALLAWTQPLLSSLNYLLSVSCLV